MKEILKKKCRNCNIYFKFDKKDLKTEEITRNERDFMEELSLHDFKISYPWWSFIPKYITTTYKITYDITYKILSLVCPCCDEKLILNTIELKRTNRKESKKVTRK